MSEANFTPRAGWCRMRNGDVVFVEPNDEKDWPWQAKHIRAGARPAKRTFKACGKWSEIEEHGFDLVEYLGETLPEWPGIEIHEMRPEPEPSEPVHKYHRRITHTLERGAIIQTGDRVTITVDVYDVLKAFDVRCPAIQHAVKKLLCAGIRGHKDRRQDLTEARASIGRAIELEGSDGMP
jgi:hypothetical protein